MGIKSKGHSSNIIINNTIYFIYIYIYFKVLLFVFYKLILFTFLYFNLIYLYPYSMVYISLMIQIWNMINTIVIFIYILVDIKKFTEINYHSIGLKKNMAPKFDKTWDR